VHQGFRARRRGGGGREGDGRACAREGGGDGTVWDRVARLEGEYDGEMTETENDRERRKQGAPRTGERVTALGVRVGVVGGLVNTAGVLLERPGRLTAHWLRFDGLRTRRRGKRAEERKGGKVLPAAAWVFRLRRRSSL